MDSGGWVNGGHGTQVLSKSPRPGLACVGPTWSVLWEPPGQFGGIVGFRGRLWLSHGLSSSWPWDGCSHKEMKALGQAAGQQ